LVRQANPITDRQFEIVFGPGVEAFAFAFAFTFG